MRTKSIKFWKNDKLHHGFQGPNGEFVSARTGNVYKTVDSIDEYPIFKGVDIWIDVEPEIRKVYFDNLRTCKDADRSKAIQVCYKLGNELHAGFLLPDDTIVRASDGARLRTLDAKETRIAANKWIDLSPCIEAQVNSWKILFKEAKPQ